jgi:ankyrin repeat protein
MAFLLGRGASVGKVKGEEVWSELIDACHANGRPAAAEFLAGRANSLNLEAAAGVGRIDIVRGFFDSTGRRKSDATEQQMKDGFTWACEYGRADVVGFLLDKGPVQSKRYLLKPIRRRRNFRMMMAAKPDKRSL